MNQNDCREPVGCLLAQFANTKVTNGGCVSYHTIWKRGVDAEPITEIGLPRLAAMVAAAEDKAKVVNLIGQCLRKGVQTYKDVKAILAEPIPEYLRNPKTSLHTIH